MGDYKYKVTGPRGGKYLTTTRKEAEALTKNGGSFRALGQKKASKVKNPSNYIKFAFVRAAKKALRAAGEVVDYDSEQRDDGAQRSVDIYVESAPGEPLHFIQLRNSGEVFLLDSDFYGKIYVGNLDEDGDLDPAGLIAALGKRRNPRRRPRKVKNPRASRTVDVHKGQNALGDKGWAWTGKDSTGRVRYTSWIYETKREATAVSKKYLSDPGRFEQHQNPGWSGWDRYSPTTWVKYRGGVAIAHLAKQGRKWAVMYKGRHLGEVSLEEGKALVDAEEPRDPYEPAPARRYSNPSFGTPITHPDVAPKIEWYRDRHGRWHGDADHGLAALGHYEIVHATALPGKPWVLSRNGTVVGEEPSLKAMKTVADWDAAFIAYHGHVPMASHGKQRNPRRRSSKAKQPYYACEACGGPALPEGVRCRDCAIAEIESLLDSPEWMKYRGSAKAEETPRHRKPGWTMADEMRADLRSLQGRRNLPHRSAHRNPAGARIIWEKMGTSVYLGYAGSHLFSILRVKPGQWHATARYNINGEIIPFGSFSTMSEAKRELGSWEETRRAGSSGSDLPSAWPERRRNPGGKPDLSGIPTSTLVSYMEMLQSTHHVAEDAYTASEREGAKVIGDELRRRGHSTPGFAQRNPEIF